MPVVRERIERLDPTGEILQEALNKLKINSNSIRQTNHTWLSFLSKESPASLQEKNTCLCFLGGK